MKPSNVLLEAAKICDQSKWGGCWAIDHVAQENGLYTSRESNEIALLTMEYFNLMKPLRIISHGYWFDRPYRSTPEQKLQRILCLLLAAEIAKSEGD